MSNNSEEFSEDELKDLETTDADLKTLELDNTLLEKEDQAIQAPTREPPESDEEDEDYKNSNKFVQVKPIFTSFDESPDTVPSESDQQYIEGFNQIAMDEVQNKEKFARIAYLIWQSKQLYYKAYRKVAVDKEHGKIEWEERAYRYHPIQEEQDEEIKLWQGHLTSLANRNRMFQLGVVNDSLYRDIINRKIPIDVTISKLEKKVLKLKFKYYFHEENDAILRQINKVDLRDLVEAAEYRENGLPFSRRQASSRSTSESREGNQKTKSSKK